MRITHTPKLAFTLVVILALPFLAFAQATLPYSTGFEQPTFSAGNVNGQDSWQVTQGTAAVQSATVHAGTQAVQLDANSTIDKAFNGSGLNIVWVEGWFRGAGTTGSANFPSTPPASAIVFFSADQGIQMLNGNKTGGGSFETTGVNPDPSNYQKVTLKLNFTSQSWDLFLNNTKKNTNPLGFRDNVTQFNGFMNFSSSGNTYLDDFLARPGQKGDGNLDGSVDVGDLIILVNEVNNPTQSSPIIKDNLDINGDGVLNNADIDALANQILGK